MDSISLLIIIITVAVIIVLFALAMYGGHLDYFNARMDELTGQDEILSPQLKQALQPLTFKVSHHEPSSYSYHYALAATTERRTILVTGELGFKVLVDGRQLVDLLTRTRNKETYAGYIFPGSEKVTIEVFSTKPMKPTIHITAPKSK